MAQSNAAQIKRVGGCDTVVAEEEAEQDQALPWIWR
jgi:hypothetical protein